MRVLLCPSNLAAPVRLPCIRFANQIGLRKTQRKRSRLDPAQNPAEFERKSKSFAAELAWQLRSQALEEAASSGQLKDAVLPFGVLASQEQQAAFGVRISWAPGLLKRRFRAVRKQQAAVVYHKAAVSVGIITSISAYIYSWYVVGVGLMSCPQE